MNIQQDFEELLGLLEDSSVKYLIVGGYAVAFHGFPRLTKDIDFFYDNSKENVDKIINCLIKFGFPKSDLDVKTFITFGNIITFGVEPVRVDFINQYDAVAWTDNAGFTDMKWIRLSYAPGKVFISFFDGFYAPARSCALAQFLPSFFA